MFFPRVGRRKARLRVLSGMLDSVAFEEGFVKRRDRLWIVMLTFFRMGEVTDIECNVNRGSSSSSLSFSSLSSPWDLGLLIPGWSSGLSSSSRERLVPEDDEFSLSIELRNVACEVNHCFRVTGEASLGHCPPAENPRRISRTGWIPDGRLSN